MEEFLTRLRDDHSDFNFGQLEDQLKNTNPATLFKKWYKEAFENNCPEPNAMTISSISEGNFPSSRIVYLKEMTDEGFIFFTNYNSQKGREITANPGVSLLFFWEKLSRQIRIKGVAEKTTADVSDNYFNSRPRESQIGAWASKQSEEISNRKTLETEFEKFEKKFENADISRPPHWGGFLIKPIYFEFWQGRENRLHDRICFEKKIIADKEWKTIRKNP